MSQSINSASQIRIILLLVLGYVFIRGVADSAQSQPRDPIRETAIKRQLMKMTSEMNKSLPRTLNPQIRLDQIWPGQGKTLEFRYTLLNVVKRNGLDLPGFVKLARPMLVNHYKSEDLFKPIRDSGVVINLRFFDKNGIYLTDFLVGPADLK